MKQLSIFVVLAFSLMSARLAVRQNYILSKDYTVTIHGTSNLHDWTEKVGNVNGTGDVNINNDGSFDLNNISIKIDVHSIKSESSIMDNNTYKALKANTCPEITFALTAPLKSIKAASGESTVAAIGNLTIAGVTKPVTMQTKVYMPANGKLTFEGEQSIKMTDYGVTPPVALFGALKTGDVITLSFKTNFVINNSL